MCISLTIQELDSYSSIFYSLNLNILFSPGSLSSVYKDAVKSIQYNLLFCIYPSLAATAFCFSLNKKTHRVHCLLLSLLLFSLQPTVVGFTLLSLIPPLLSSTHCSGFHTLISYMSSLLGTSSCLVTQLSVLSTQSFLVSPLNTLPFKGAHS